MASDLLVPLIADISAKLSSAVVKDALSSFSENMKAEDLNQVIRSLEEVKFIVQQRSSQTEEMTEWLRRVEEVAYVLDNLLDESVAAISQVKHLPLYLSFYGGSLAVKAKSTLRKIQSVIAYSVSFLNPNFPIDFIRPSQNEGESNSSMPKIIVGREDSKRTMINYLIHKEYAGNLVVIPIVGLGGMGKTVLAKLLYSCDEIVNHFQLLIWIDVSDDFNLKAILTKIVTVLTQEVCDYLEMEFLKRRIWEQIDGKRYLVVLDNVQSDDILLWSNLRDLLIVGAKGSRVVITTRELSVAEAARPGFIYELHELPQEESWMLFKCFAFRDGYVPTYEFETIGREITRKCYGVPLAIKHLGLLMSSKTTVEEWLGVKDKMLVDIDEDRILCILQLAYNNLPLHLKICFLYCGIFPKGKPIDVLILVSLWSAQGLIKKSEGKKRGKDIGLHYVQELIKKGLLENINNELEDMIATRMHDLVHDFCMNLLKGQILVDNEGENVSCNTRHLRVLGCNKYWKVPFTMLRAKNNLRTLILRGDLEQTQWELMVKSFKKLRVLDVSMSNCLITPSIGELVHLRYLDLSFIVNVKILPESITELWHLQVLKLDGCISLEELPKAMKKLVNLTELSLWNVPLTQMPKGIGNLTKLCKLSTFTVSNKRTSATLKELSRLYNLRGTLSIVSLENAREFECKEAVLKEINGLEELELGWGSGSFSDMRTMNALIPPDDLKRIKVDGYGGALFPDWLFRLSALSQISIVGCYNLSDLSHLHRMRSLKKLSICRINLEFIERCEGHNLYENLEIIEIIGCEMLKGWCKEGCISQFPVLSELRIHKSPEFKFFTGNAPNLDSNNGNWKIGGITSDQLSHGVGRYQYLHLKIDLTDDKDKNRAMECVFNNQGVDWVTIGMNLKTLTIIGTADPDIVVHKLRKCGWSIEVLSFSQ